MNDVPLRNRLLGTFHVRIAEMVGNKVLTDILADLVTRSSLITLLLQSTKGASCSSDEHRELIALCEEMVAAQRREIQQMESWLCQWYGVWCSQSER